MALGPRPLFAPGAPPPSPPLLSSHSLEVTSSRFPAPSPPPGAYPAHRPPAGAFARASRGASGAGGRTAGAASARVRTACRRGLLARLRSAVPGAQQRARGAGRRPAVAP